MALVIEDGSGVSGANSYVSVSDARAYATARGLSLPVADADVEKLLIKAKDYIESFRADFQGSKTDKYNPLQWPRTGATLDGFDLDDDEIPELIPDAQAQLACEQASGEVLMPNSTGREVVREKVEGAVEVQYAETGSAAVEPIFAVAEALLSPLLGSGSGGLSLQSVRV